MSAARAARAFIETAIKDHNVVVFSKTTCPFSILAKRILSEVGVQEMQVYEIELREDGREIQVRRSENPGTIPTPSNSCSRLHTPPLSGMLQDGERFLSWVL